MAILTSYFVFVYLWLMWMVGSGNGDYQSAFDSTVTRENWRECFDPVFYLCCREMSGHTYHLTYLMSIVNGLLFLAMEPYISSMVIPPVWPYNDLDLNYTSAICVGDHWRSCSILSKTKSGYGIHCKPFQMVIPLEMDTCIGRFWLRYTGLCDRVTHIYPVSIFRYVLTFL